MKYKVATGIMIILFLSSMLSLAFNIQPARTEPTTWTVDDGGPADYSSIQEAINVAEDGDTVLVMAGTYVENIDFLGKAITVKSEEGPEETIIDGGLSGSVVTFDSGEDQDSSVSGFTIINGRARFGGGIFCNNSSPRITNNIITHNLAEFGSLGRCGGGGIFASNSGVTIADNIIRFNSVRNYYEYTEGPFEDSGGGGIFCWTPHPQNLLTFPLISGNTIEYNSVSGYFATGGGISEGYYEMDRRATIVNNTISHNTVYGSWAGHGGGIEGGYLIINNVIRNNVNPSNTGGGGVSRPNGEMINNVITANIASYGGGICFWYGSVTLRNNIISDNSACSHTYGQGGGIYSGRAAIAVVNCIVSGNSAYIGSPEIYLFELAPGDVDVMYSNVQGGWEGIGNIDADPLFVNPALDDYHLQPSSPCIDAGANEYAPDTDLDGNPRPIDGDKDGVAVADIGAYEFKFPFASFEYSPATPSPLQSVVFNASSSYSPDSNIVSYEWDFDDGNMTTVTAPTITHVFDEEGNYTVTLKVTDDQGSWNLFLKQVVVEKILGDVNGDGAVDIFDVVLAALAFGSKPEDPNWNIAADLNNDDVVDIFDVVLLANNFGKTT